MDKLLLIQSTIALHVGYGENTCSLSGKNKNSVDINLQCSIKEKNPKAHKANQFYHLYPLS